MKPWPVEICRQLHTVRWRLGFHLGRLKELSFLDNMTFPALKLALQWLKFYRMHFPSVWSKLFMHFIKTHAQPWSITFCKPLEDILWAHIEFLEWEERRLQNAASAKSFLKAVSRGQKETSHLWTVFTTDTQCEQYLQIREWIHG